MKKIIAVLCAAVLLLCSGCSSGNEMREMTTAEIVKEMGYGINLGNTLESCGNWISGGKTSNYETAWGSPVITEEMIKGYADAGFGVLRVPVAWSNMMEKDGTYTINPEYMARAKEVVDWALDTGIYVIVNIHYDNGWAKKFPEEKDECMKRFKAMWTQIAETFKDYGDKLMFEAQNEELGWESLWNRWTSKNEEEKRSSFDLVLEVNQAFVDVVRGSGGNNGLRHLLISGYNTGVELTCDEMFRMPEDPANRMAVSVHYYHPTTLTIIDKDASWGKAETEWGDEDDIAELNKNVKLLKETFVDKGIPVIVGEYGCFGKNKTREVIEKYTLTVSSSLYEAGMCPILWDTSGDEYDRRASSFRNPEFIEKLIAPSKK